MSVSTFACEVAAERQRRDDKWGPNRHFPSVSFDNRAGGVEYTYHGIVIEARGKELCQAQHADTICWADILTEEVAEAYAAKNETDRRTELIQCAAVIFAWIEDLDSRKETA